ncbi:MAG TPA: ATP-dependent sacrificial sulfur transferase LarE [Candidatus Sulfotelmatobacter sp.]|nr:ATP-dependent sacrificial sulfur transferase LarE [Candidatus Sulfotelmatobacter sp.]
MSKEKEKKLEELLAGLKKVLVAFSGGVDSTYLLAVARRVLGKENVFALIAESPTYPVEEIENAIKMADKLDVRTIVIKTEEFFDENFVANGRERCYYCKKELFAKMKKLAEEKGVGTIIDGSNYDDLSDYRPGNRAKEEFKALSPLQLLEFSKDEVRQLSKQAGLPTHDKPSMACLASRIPYGVRITERALGQISAAEKYLRSLGLRQVRVRHHDIVARIEVGVDELSKIMNEETRKKIIERLEELGYCFVTLDLKGYRAGSMNENLS